MQIIRIFLQWLKNQFIQIDQQYNALKNPGPPGKRAGTIILISLLVLISVEYIAKEITFKQFITTVLVKTPIPADPELLHLISWSFGTVLYYLIIPVIIIKFAFRGSLKSYGLTTKNYFKHFWIYLVLFLPMLVVLFFVSKSPEFLAKYPFYDNPVSISALLIWELAYALQFLALEFFFRGFMLHGLAKRYGTAAIWIMVIPYTMIHFQKPLLETVGAGVAGIILGLLSLRTKSILGGATIHIAVAWSMDLLSLLNEGYFS